MKNKSVMMIAIYNPDGEWIGNISINTKTLEVEDSLKNGYKIGNKKGE